MTRVCIDLTANEIIDRFGGIGRYGYLLLESLVSLPAAERAGIELCALEDSAGSVIGAEQALEKAVLSRRTLPLRRHRWQRRLVTGKSLVNGRVDLFHAVQPLALPLWPRAKVLATCHDLIPVVFPRQGSALKSNWIVLRETAVWGLRMRRVDHILAISEQTATDLSSRLGIARSKISVVHHGVDAKLFHPRADPVAARRKFDLPERWFVSVGSDHYRKNHRALFEAWCNAGPDIPEGLVVVGKALYESTLQELNAKVVQLGLQHRFRWLDNVDDTDLPGLYCGATAAIAPSLYEGFGMTLLEAMACGTPVAAARNGAYEEVGGDAAIYFDGRSVSALETTLRQLSGDPQERERLSQAGRRQASEMTWERTARQTLEVYRRVAETKPPCTP